MHHVAAALAVTFVSGIQLYACSSSTGRVTSLPADKTLASLTNEERRQYCEDQSQYMSSRVSTSDRRKIDCAAAAAAVGGGKGSSGRAQAACRTAYQACLSVPGAAPEDTCDAFPAKADGCKATVDELSKCAEAQADALEKRASEADGTCKNAARTGAAELPKTPEACARAELLCPKIFEEPTKSTARR